MADTAVLPQSGPASQRYAALESLRQVYLLRAQEASLFTLPMLIPPQGHSSTTRYPTPYQSLGARGVNNLASKLLLALFPPNTPFFRLAVDDFTLERLAGRTGARAEVEKALSKVERAVMTEIETSPTRAPLFEGLKHLLVAGNVLLHMMPTGGMKVFHLDQYVVKRDPAGNVLEILTKEVVSEMEIPEAVRPALLGDRPHDEGKGDPVEDNIEVYTWVQRTDKGWSIQQEINGKIVPGSQGTYPLDKSPWLPERFITISGEDYGRGFVEEYLGDLKSLEGLSKAIVQGSAAAAKVLFLIKPNSTTNAKDIARKESGEFAVGHKDDVTVLQMEKYADFKVAQEMRAALVESLSYAFMLNSAIQRNAERVTAEEIRFMANELETGLGGVYSSLSQELQLPFVSRLMFQMERDKKLPALPKGVVRPMITTGIEAIGRGNDLTKLAGLLQDISPLGSEVIAQYLNVGDYISRCATARGIDDDGLINDEQTVQANQQRAQMQSMVEKLGPNAINQVGGMAQQRMQQQATPQQPQSGA